MAKAKTDNLIWQDIDPSTLDPALQAAYAAYKVQQRKAAELRDAFSKAMNEAAGLPVGSKLVCGFGFGKLSIAIAPDDAPKAAPKGAVSLSAFIAAQKAMGART